MIVQDYMACYRYYVLSMWSYYFFFWIWRKSVLSGVTDTPVFEICPGFQRQDGFPHLRASSIACNRFLRFISGGTPADFLAASMLLLFFTFVVRITCWIYRKQKVLTAGKKARWSFLFQREKENVSIFICCCFCFITFRLTWHPREICWKYFTSLIFGLTACIGQIFWGKNFLRNFKWCSTAFFSCSELKKFIAQFKSVGKKICPILFQKIAQKMMWENIK